MARLRPFDKLRTTPRQSSFFTSFRTKTGGGGGSRTRVRKYSTKASTYISRILSVGRQSAFGQAIERLIPVKVLAPAEPAIGSSQPANRRPFQTRRQNLEGRWLKQPERSYNRLRLCLGSRRFTCGQESTVCSLSFIIPVEAVSPPQSWVGWLNPQTFEY